ncbi:MAG: UPF0262 family protein [Alphaproteobacteria bacterium]|nr:UPF0262 family protein [Alphaproteobacteria bacterium]
MDKIARLTVAQPGIVRYNPEIEKERAVAIYDLLQDNSFRYLGHGPGPYAVTLALKDQSLVLDIADATDAPIGQVSLPLGSLRKTIKDYFTVCDSYFEAIRTSTLQRIEAIDMGRRGLHNEGSELLRSRLAGQVEIDDLTARRLFTLLCVMHLKA